MSNMNDEIYSTEEVAAKIGIARSSFLVWLSRYPEYKPARRVGAIHVWLPADIDRAIAGRATTRARAGRKKKSK